jgi:hypothetical protein
MAAGLVELFDFESRAAAMAAFERTLRHCAVHEIACRPFIGPMHGVYLTALRETDWARFQAWKEEIAAIAVRHGVALFDFASALPESAQPFAQAPGRFHDSLHYGPAIGARVLALMDAAEGEPNRATADPDRLGALRARDEAAAVEFARNDPEFAAALVRAIRARAARQRAD